jgi:polyribonucleotide nucleotidyltransferase
VNGEYVLNPTFEQIEKSQLEIVVAGTAEGFTMVEGGANEASEDIMLGRKRKTRYEKPRKPKKLSYEFYHFK